VEAVPSALKTDAGQPMCLGQPARINPPRERTDPVTNVPETTAKNATCGLLASDLRRVADALDTVADLELQADPYVTLGVQPGGTDAEIAARTDAIGKALFGKLGAAKRMGGNTWHYAAEGRFGLVQVDVYDGIADPETPAREAELERLRARVAELEADR
jgi:hypothetical protein